MSSDLYKKINLTIEQNHMLEGCSGIVLAVSGGADSMTVLDFFINNKMGVPIAVGHINHLLRVESDSEEKMLSDYCKENGVDFYSLRADIKNDCPKGMSTETYARQVRYDYLHSLRKKLGFSHIATAHNLDDNIETLFMNIIRGSGLKGLTAIPYIREDGVIRPLIETEKKDIIAHCEENNIPYAVDKTNFDDIYTRNLFRNKVIPLLKQINPNLYNTPIIELAKTELSYIEEQTRKAEKELVTKKDRVKIKNQHKCIMGHVFRNVFYSLSFQTLDSFHTKALLDLSDCSVGTECQLPYGYYARRGYDEIVFFKDETNFFEISKKEIFLGDNIIDGLGNIHIKESDTFPLYVRSRKAGDKVKLSGGTKSLKKLFSDMKIPLEDRGKYFVIVDKDDVPVYVRDIKIITKKSIKIEFGNI